MAEEDLTASHWDDVISPNHQGFSIHTESLSLMNEFDDLNIYSNNEFTKSTDDSTKAYTQSSLNLFSQGEASNSAHNNGNSSNYDQYRPAQQPFDEQRDEDEDEDESTAERNKLLSELTGPEENPLSSIASPFTKPSNESLFNDSNNLIQVDDESTSGAAPLEDSPKKSVMRGKNLYVSRRPRRFKPNCILNEGKKESEDEKSSQGLEQNLGPLGETKDESKAPVEEEHGRNELVKAVDEPLYGKKVENKSQSGISSSASQKSVTSGQAQKDHKISSSIEGEDNDDGIKMTITVGDPIRIGDLATAHIIYSVKTETNSDKFPSNSIMVSRRYSDFRWIYHQLQNNNPGYIIPPPPLKKSLGRFDENFIENRRLLLEKMLDKISRHKILKNDQDFVMFLSSENFHYDSKERERISGSDASKQVDEFVEDDASSNGGSGSGLLNSISNAFSISTKVVENDDFFSDKKSYINDLEISLKNFYKSLEFLINQRNELSSVLLEISNVSNKLSELEISKNSVALFYEFSLNHEKLSSIFERCSLQDMLTLGLTIEEYLRIIGSIKTILKQRIAAQTDYYNLEAEILKKQNNLSKLIKKNSGLNPQSNEKIKLYEKELSSFENKLTLNKIKFDNLSNTIKSEFSKFEINKVNDFRNSIETYLESYIESQKEAIELWETFYERNSKNV